MNILLTGSDGFIGGHLFRYFSENHNVIGLDIKSGNDILEVEFPDNIDLVVHMAGMSGVRDSLDRPTEYWKNNVIGTQRLFQHYSDTRIIYASSSTAHEPWKNPYAMSKYCMEQLEHDNAVGLRFTTVYGPQARGEMLIPKILNNEVEYLNTNHSRDFIHVDDVVRAIQTMIDSDFIGVIDVGTGTTNKLTDIAEYFNIDYRPEVGGETERLDNKADTTVLNLFGWKAEINLYDHIYEMSLKH
jgi:nucleoside-diphosphate-sugar epimerase